MLVKDILKLACEFLDNSSLAEKVTAGDKTEDEAKEIANLEKCFNLVREEIATEILPIIKIDRLKTQNLKISFEEFSFAPVSILAVKDCNGRTVKHRILDDSIIVFANEVEVWYSTKPEVLTAEDEFASTLPERVYAYGVAREYYIKKALYKDAEVWEERFKNSIEMLDRKKSGVTIPRRRWL